MSERPPSKKDPRRGLGATGERLAREHLETLGYRVLETNYRTRYGELDIVAIEGGCLVGVEVRTKRGVGFGTPEDSITATKARRLCELIEGYGQAHPGLPEDLRVDFVAIEMTAAGSVMRLEVIKSAVTE